MKIFSGENQCMEMFPCNFFLFQRRVCVDLRSVYCKGDNDFWRSGQDNPWGMQYLFFLFCFLFFPSLKLQQSQKYFRNMWENILKNMSVLRRKNINELQYCSKQKTFVFWGDERLLNENLNDFFFQSWKIFIGSYYSWKLK